MEITDRWKEGNWKIGIERMKNNGLDVQVEIDERTKQWNDSGQTNEQIDKWTDG